MRQNRQNFYQAAGAAENVNQYKFGIDNERAMLAKQSGAGLVNDALMNIMNRKQYEDTHGKGSQYYEYMKELTKGQWENTRSLEDANEQRKLEALADLQTGLDAKKKQLEGMTNSFSNSNDFDKVVPADKLPSGPGTGIVNAATTGLVNEVVNPPKGKTVEQMKDAGYQNIQQENVVDQSVGKDLTTTAGTKYNPGMGLAGSIYGGQKQLPVNDKQAIKVMEQNGANVYQQVLNTPEYQKKITDINGAYDSEIDTLKKQLQSPKLSMAKMKQLEAKIKDLESKKSKEIDSATKEQEKWADSQFDENGKYIGHLK
jgi:hypothetical protein